MHQEPTDWLGDAHLADVCAPGSNVLRYVNVHEDPSSVSLALEPSAVRAVQRTPIPLAVDASDRWIVDANKRRLATASKPSEHDRPNSQPWMRPEGSGLLSEARTLEFEVAEWLPTHLGARFGTDFNEPLFEEDPVAFPAKLAGLAQLVTNAQAALIALDAQPWLSLIGGDAELLGN